MALDEQDVSLWKRVAFAKMLHSPRLRWRTAFTYAVIILLIMAGLAYYLATSLDAPLAAVAGPVLLAALLIIALMVFQAERAAHTVRRLTVMAERIAQGDLEARITSLSSGEIGQLARTFNRMASRLQKQIQKRARQKERLNTVLYALTDGVLIINRRGEVKLLNPAAARILNTTEQQALNRTVVQVVRDHRIAEVFNLCLKSKQEEVALHELEDGRFLRIVATPYLKGNNRGHVLILQDLTQLHQLQIIRHDFITNISHELRTPLASLRALVETLADSAMDDPPAAQRFLQRMEVEVDALSQMVQELLDLSQIEGGQAPLRLQSVPAAEILRTSAERLRPQVERAQLALHIDLPDELPQITVDPDRVQQVAANLLHNAIKFTPAGGYVAITAHPDAHGNELIVSVRDSGVGISPDDLPRIFERFYKADRARSGGGTGLGLAIAKHVILAHGGRIWAESVPGKGSTFYFSFPLEAAAAEHPSHDLNTAAPAR